MKKTLKKPLIAFFVLSLVFLVAWLTLVTVNCLAVLKVPVGDFFLGLVRPLWEGMAGGAPALVYGDGIWFPRGFAGGAWCWSTYVAICAAAIFLILLIVGIVLTIINKRKRYIPYALVLLLTFFGAVLFAEYPSQSVAIFLWQAGTDVTSILIFCAIVCAILALIFSVVTFVIGCVHAARLLQNATLPEQVEIPALEPVKEENALEELTAVEETPVVPAESEDVTEAFTTVASEDNNVAVEEVEKPVDYQPMNDFMVEPNELTAEPEEIVVEEIKAQEEEKPEAAKPIDTNDLAALIKDVVRDIVRDEIARSVASKQEEENRPHHNCEQPSITGATFGGPLVVQYFNGGINSPAPAPVVAAPAPVVAAAPAPAPAPVVPPAPVQEEPAAPVVEEKPVETKPEVKPAPKKEEEPKPAAEHKEIVRIPFEQRMVSADKEMQMNYNDLKNEILSWGVNSRVSNSGDTFRLHKKTYVKITIAGKSLKLYFALNPNDYKDSPIPVGDASSKAIYAEIPLIFKVKSPLSVKRAKGLIQEVMERDGLEQKEVGSVNWVKEIKANLK